MDSKTPTPRRTFTRLLIMAVWFGAVTGLVEGFGLLLFQQINWERWGPMFHMSKEILWISPLVDTLFAVLLAIPLALLAWIFPRFSAIRVGVVVFSSLMIGSWLTVTGRLSHVSCLLLSLGLGAAFGRWVRSREESLLKFCSRSLPIPVTAAIAAFVAVQGGAWLAERKALAKLPAALNGTPNVLVIVVDTLRADHLSTYGYPRETSPNIDRLAREGVLFENAISVTSWTFPSHVSLVTGRYPFQHGMGNVRPETLSAKDEDRLGGLPVIGESFQRMGYRTAAFSANHSYFTGNLGFKRGFHHFEDYFFSAADGFVRTILGQEAMRIGSQKNVRKVLAFFGLRETLDLNSPKWDYVVPDLVLRTHASSVNKSLLDWIDDGPRDHPFFAFLNYYDVHAPYGGPHEVKPAWPLANRIDRYDAGIHYDDAAIGKLLNELETRGLARNTLVVVTADHGESLGDHGLQRHGKSLYSSLIHVPLVFWYPGHVPAGKRIETPVTNASLPATLMSILHQAASFPLPAVDALWLNPGKSYDWPSPLSELDLQYRDADIADKNLVPSSERGPMKSLISQQWHLITHKTLGDQIYDLASDPKELNNLINSPAGQSAALAMMDRMQDTLANVTPKEKDLKLSSAVAFEPRAVDFKPIVRNVSLHRPIHDYYRVAVAPGSTVAVEVHARKNETARALDPVVTIADSDGNLVQTCRNRSDDALPAPGIVDQTPNAFDDICMNHDMEDGDTSHAVLEIRTPDGAAPVEYYVGIADWNGRAEAETYQLVVKRTQ